MKNFHFFLLSLSTSLLFALFLIPFSASAFSEVNIDVKGKAVVKGAKVMQLAGPTLYTRLYWGDSFVRLLVKSGNSTKITRSFGEATTVSEIKVGDILDMEGELESAATSLVLIPSVIRDRSIEKEQNEFSGTVIGFATSTAGVTLYSKAKGIVTVSISTTTVVHKGSRIIDLARIKVGDIVNSVSGEYDYQTKTITANKIIIFFDKKTLEPQVFEGTLKTLPLGVAPTTMVVLINGTNYTIDMKADVKFRNTARETTSLSRFLLGDTIRIYGAIREADLPIIDAYIVRNINL